MNNLVVVRGGGDIATGTIYKLARCGFHVLVLEIEHPSAIRRNVAYSEAVYDGYKEVEGIECVLIHSLNELESVFKHNKIAMMVDPKGSSIDILKPEIVIDAILAKKNMGTSRNMAPITIGLGPGFNAGKDVDIVIETMRGHRLGRLIEEGPAMKNTGIPVVLVDYTSLGDTCDCVLTHNKQGGYLITQYVLDKGYKRVGFFGDLEYSLSFSDRFMGYKQALVNRNTISDIESYINQYSILHETEKYVLENDVNSIVSLLKKSELPEVFVCANDSNAFILLNALTLMNIKVPDQIAITGFDDTPLCDKTIPKLTTVQVQKELMGEIAVNKLIDRIHRENDVQMTQLLSTKIIERDSVK